MNVVVRVWRKTAAWLRGGAHDRDLQDELSAHLALAADDYERRGLPPAEARRAAALAMGSIDAARERHRDARGLPTLDSLRQDAVYAVRGFVREPGFTVVALLILSLGIGANTAVFSVVNPLLLRPLPFAGADALVWIEPDTAERGLSDLTYPANVFEAVAGASRSFDRLGAYFAFFGYDSYKLTGRGEARRLSGVLVTRGFFETLGVSPRLGRTFTADEHAPNGPRAAILTHALWQRTFAADPAIVGGTAIVNGEPFTVAGVLPPDFDFSSVFTPGVAVDLFTPARIDEMRQWGNIFAVVGRLRPGVSIDAARAEFAALMPRLNEQNPEWGERSARLVPLKAHVSGPLERALLILWAAVGLVLLIVCANLSNLLLARTAARRRELAVRMALGAGRARVIRQLLTEGVVLAAAGAALGVPLAYALTAYLRGQATLSLPMLDRVGVDAPALAFTAAAAIVTGLTLGAIPALRIKAHQPVDVLREQGRGSTDGRGQAWLRASLVVTEIALACVLLVGAGLLVRSFLQVLDVELGFQPSRAMAVRVEPSATLSRPERVAILEEVARRVRALPGVEAAGLADALPLERNRTWGLRAEGDDSVEGRNRGAFVYVVGAGYFGAMGVPLRAGRDFDGRDTSASGDVMVLNESAARALWPDQEAVGHTALSGDRAYRVIGVVADVRQTGLEDAPAPQMYVVHTQVGAGSMDLLVRSSLPPAALSGSVRAAVGSLDPDLLTTTLRPVGDLVERAVSPRRFLVTLLGGFSLLAVVLASLGIYGVVSYTVSQRTLEMGIRVALGATAADVRRHVLAGTLKVALAGIAAGVAGALVAARLMAALLYETSPVDPLAFGAAIVGLTLVALVAGYLPALRASRASPMRALRAE